MVEQPTEEYEEFMRLFSEGERTGEETGVEEGEQEVGVRAEPLQTINEGAQGLPAPELLSAPQDEESAQQEGPRRSSRTHRRPTTLVYTRPGEPSIGEFSGAVNLSQIPVPASLKEAMRGPHAKEWLQGIMEEMKSLEKNDTWTLVELPMGKSA
jgi:hypothetical protein